MMIGTYQKLLIQICLGDIQQFIYIGKKLNNVQKMINEYNKINKNDNITKKIKKNKHKYQNFQNN